MSTTCSALCQSTDGSELACALAVSWNSVRVKPGQSAITRTPEPRSSSRTASLKLVTNALVAE